MTDNFEWVTNTKPNAKDNNMSLDDYVRWANQFITGLPKATEFHSVQSLRNMGLVGFYRQHPTD